MAKEKITTTNISMKRPPPDQDARAAEAWLRQEQIELRVEWDILTVDEVELRTMDYIDLGEPQGSLEKMGGKKGDWVWHITTTSGSFSEF